MSLCAIASEQLRLSWVNDVRESAGVPLVTELPGECAYVFPGSTTYHRSPRCRSFDRYSWAQMSAMIQAGRLLLLHKPPADGHPCAFCHGKRGYEDFAA